MQIYTGARVRGLAEASPGYVPSPSEVQRHRLLIKAGEVVRSYYFNGSPMRPLRSWANSSIRRSPSRYTLASHPSIYCANLEIRNTHLDLATLRRDRAGNPRTTAPPLPGAIRLSYQGKHSHTHGDGSFQMMLQETLALNALMPDSQIRADRCRILGSRETPLTRLFLPGSPEDLSFGAKLMQRAINT